MKKNKVEDDERSARKDGIKEKYDRKGKEGEKSDAQMWKDVKKEHTCNSIKTSVGVQNRL